MPTDTNISVTPQTRVTWSSITAITAWMDSQKELDSQKQAVLAHVLTWHCGVGVGYLK